MRDESLTEEQRMVRDMIAELTAGSVASQAVAIDETSTIGEGLRQELAELGLLSVPLSEEAGGAGFDFVSLALVLASIASESGAVAQHVLLQTVGGVMMLAETGAPVERLEAVAGGEQAAAFCELAQGAAWDRNADCVTGEAQCVLGGVEADLFLAFVRDESSSVLLLVDAEKVSKGESKNRLGMRGVTACDVRFEGAAATVLAEGAAAIGPVAMRQTREWVGALAIASGLAQGISSISCKYAREREQFGGPIARLGAVGEMMARTDVAHRVISECAHSLAAALDRSEDVTADARSARIVAGDLIMRAADAGLQIHGGYGFSREYPIERFRPCPWGS